MRVLLSVRGMVLIDEILHDDEDVKTHFSRRSRHFPSDWKGEGVADEGCRRSARGCSSRPSIWASLGMRPPRLQTRSACSSMRCRPPSSCLASPHSPLWRAPARTLLLPPTPARCHRLWPRLEPGSACPLPCGVDLLPADQQGLGIESCPSRNVKRAHRDAKHTAVRAEVDEDGLVPTPAKLQLPGAPRRADSSCPCTVP